MSNLLEKLENYKNNFYTEHTKNVFLKKKQKMQCAQEISSQFQLEDLLSKTVYCIPNTKKIYIDYTIFKLFAHPNIFQTIIEHTQNILDDCVQKNDGFEAHVNLNTFTISAAERYRSIIQIFYDTALRKNTVYYKKLDKMYVYYTPSTIGDVAKIFLNPEILPKVKTYSKEESNQKIDELFSSDQTDICSFA